MLNVISEGLMVGGLYNVLCGKRIKQDARSNGEKHETTSPVATPRDPSKYWKNAVSRETVCTTQNWKLQL
jgi:hypothetical protein